MGLLEFLGFRIFVFFLGWAFLLRFYLGFLSIFGGDFISCGVFLWVFVGLGFFLWVYIQFYIQFYLLFYILYWILDSIRYSRIYSRVYSLFYSRFYSNFQFYFLVFSRPIFYFLFLQHNPTRWRCGPGGFLSPGVTRWCHPGVTPMSPPPNSCPGESATEIPPIKKWGFGEARPSALPRSQAKGKNLHFPRVSGLPFPPCKIPSLHSHVHLSNRNILGFSCRVLFSPAALGAPQFPSEHFWGNGSKISKSAHRKNSHRKEKRKSLFLYYIFMLMGTGTIESFFPPRLILQRQNPFIQRGSLPAFHPGRARFSALINLSASF